MTAYSYDQVEHAEWLRERASIEFRWKELLVEQRQMLERLRDIEIERHELRLEAKAYHLNLEEV
jgi:hypothetical protein